MYGLNLWRDTKRAEDGQVVSLLEGRGGGVRIIPAFQSSTCCFEMF